MGWYFVSLVHNESAARSAQGDCQKRLISGCQKLIDNCTVLCRDCLPTLPSFCFHHVPLRPKLGAACAVSVRAAGVSIKI